uniref:Integrin beta N-terminal domain-containing protein n=1 Tax=Branchiostoma floridae TaxID=7739 RepID=C3YNY5_BRAFL|eukprot:XP_002601972.1 hypothetical protein BRAFLDRAFT_98925 [Branchiostoma floridae]
MRVVAAVLPVCLLIAAAAAQDNPPIGGDTERRIGPFLNPTNPCLSANARTCKECLRVDQQCGWCSSEQGVITKNIDLGGSGGGGIKANGQRWGHAECLADPITCGEVGGELAGRTGGGGASEEEEVPLEEEEEGVPSAEEEAPLEEAAAAEEEEEGEEEVVPSEVEAVPSEVVEAVPVEEAVVPGEAFSSEEEGLEAAEAVALETRSSGFIIYPNECDVHLLVYNYLIKISRTTNRSIRTQVPRQVPVAAVHLRSLVRLEEKAV